MKTEVRLATTADAARLVALIERCYGADYPYREFYDRGSVAAMLARRDQTWVVAARGPDAIASCRVSSIGRPGDGVCMFGAMAVCPEYGGRGLGAAVFGATEQLAATRYRVGLAEARRASRPAQLLLERRGFVPVGSDLDFDPDSRVGEHSVYMKHYCDPCQRKRAPARVLPSIEALAAHASGVALPHATLPRAARAEPAWPARADGALQSLLPGERSSLEFAWPPRCVMGHAPAQARPYHGVVAWRQGRQLSATLAYRLLAAPRGLEVTHLRGVERGAMSSLLRAFIGARPDAAPWNYMRIDVSAGEPGLQALLLELGFVPAAVLPALVHDEAGALVDVIRMVRSTSPVRFALERCTAAGRACLEAMGADANGLLTIRGPWTAPRRLDGDQGRNTA